MSFLNGAELCLNFKPATADFKRRLAHAKRMDSKRARSPSRVLVANALMTWRVSAGYPANSNVYPAGVNVEDFTNLVNWAKAQ